MTGIAQFAGRDYSLTGESARHAITAGLAAAEWYHTDVPRKDMKALMALWILLQLATATGGIWFWGTWACVPFWIAYGVLYGSASDSRWHECGHGTAFRTGWMNDAAYQIASFQVMRNPVNWRWSHARHRTDAIIVGRDAELAWMHPVNLALKSLAYVGGVDVWTYFKGIIPNALGILAPDERNFIPVSEWPKVVTATRSHVATSAVTVLAALALLMMGMGSRALIRLMLIGLPRIYGCWQ